MNVPLPESSLATQALRRVGASLGGRYTLHRLIAVGGMAAVYAGEHRNGHVVAIKVLHDRLSADPEVERLFRREALLANKVSHPGVVPVIDDDTTEDGCTFLVMPLLEGETLRARAARMEGRLSTPEVVVAARAILEALAAAHERKIVHRDIKPENVFLTRGGDVRILDFGIGRLLEGGDATATRSGRAVGTPAFMAPEQALGHLKNVDERTDLWAVGATMYSLLAGRFVHEGATPNETLVFAATRSPAPLREVAAGVPDAIVAVVDRALAFERADRWPSARAMVAALDDACRASLGAEASSLPRLAVPEAPVPEDVHAEVTRPPVLTASLFDRVQSPTTAPSSGTRQAWEARPPSERGTGAGQERARRMPGMVTVDEVNLRGTAVAPVRSFVPKRFGEKAWSVFLAALDPEQRALIEEPVIATNWYPYAYCCAYIDQIAALGRGQPGILREFAFHTLDYATNVVFRAIFKLGTPEFMVARSNQVWKKLYSHGSMVCDARAGHARIELHDFPMMNERYSDVVKHSVEAVLVKAGARVTSARTTKSTLHGDGLSEFTYEWA